MNRIPALALALLVCAAPSFAQKVTVDFDEGYDFGQIDSYQWVEPEEIPVSPLMQQRVAEAIRYHLAMLGVERVDESPDVLVTYHARGEDEVVIHSDHFGYGYGPRWRWGGGMGTTTSRSYTYTKGTLVFDVWDAKTKNMVFRGTITDTVSDKPEKNEKKINKGAEKLFKEFEKQYEKAQKKKGE